MEITIEWDQRVAGREPGQRETVEETPFITACIAQGRCAVIAPPAPAPVFEDPASALAVVEETAKAAKAKFDADQAEQAQIDAHRAAAVDAALKADEDAKAVLAAADAALAALQPIVTPEA